MSQPTRTQAEAVVTALFGRNPKAPASTGGPVAVADILEAASKARHPSSGDVTVGGRG